MIHYDQEDNQATHVCAVCVQLVLHSIYLWLSRYLYYIHTYACFHNIINISHFFFKLCKKIFINFGIGRLSLAEMYIVATLSYFSKSSQSTGASISRLTLWNNIRRCSSVISDCKKQLFYFYNLSLACL